MSEPTFWLLVFVALWLIAEARNLIHQADADRWKKLAEMRAADKRFLLRRLAEYERHPSVGADVIDFPTFVLDETTEEVEFRA